MDPFADLLSLGGGPAAAAPLPAASGFDFLAPAAPARPAAGSVSVGDAFGDLEALMDAPLPPPGAIGAASAPGASGTVPSAASAISADPSSLSVGALKKLLDGLGIDRSGCTEKHELVALARRAAGGAGAAVGAAAPAGGTSDLRALAPTGATASGGAGSLSGGASLALELGLPNAFEVTGMSSLAPDAVKSIEHERQYAAQRAAAAGFRVGGAAPPPSGGLGSGAATSADVAAALSAIVRVSVAALPIPVAPAARLRVRVPAAALSPSIREVPASHVRECVTEVTAAPSAAAQKALIPHAGHSLVGPRRFFEVPLRPDVSNAAVLAAVASAAAGSSMDVTFSSSRSAVLSHRVSVPSAAWSAFTGSARFSAAAAAQAAGKPAPAAVQVGRTAQEEKEAAARAAASGSGSSWTGSLLGGLLGAGSRTVYVSSLVALLGTNAGKERVLILAAARFVPDPARPAEEYGRLVFRSRPGGAAEDAPGAAGGKGSSGSGTGRASSSAASLAALGLGGAAAGITCVLAEQRAVPQPSYASVESGVGTAAAAADLTAAADLDAFGLPTAAGGASCGSRSGSSSTAATPEEGRLLSAAPLPSSIRAASSAGAGVSVRADSLPELADVAVGPEELARLWPRLQDGSEIVEAAVADWSALRVSFLAPAVAPVAALPASKAAAAAAGGAPAAPAPSSSAFDDLAGLGLGGGGAAGDASGSSGAGPDTFPLADVEDDLLQAACAVTAGMRGGGGGGGSVLAEGVWADAVAAAKAVVAAQRGEGDAAAALAGSRPPDAFLVHADTRAGMLAGWRAEGEAALFKAAIPYDNVAKHDEALLAAVERPLAPAFAAAKAEPAPAPAIPSLAAMPLDAAAEGEGMAGDATGGGVFQGGDSAAAALVPPTPPGLTPADEALRAVYLRAYATCRALAGAALAVRQAAEHAAAAEMRARLQRKKRHVGLRRAAAFWRAAALVSQLQEVAATAPPPAAGAPADPARTLLCSVFGVAGEAPLVHAAAAALKLAGEVLVTPRRVAFTATVLGVRAAKRDVPVDALVGLHPSHTPLLGDAITLTYLDSDKAAAAAKEKEAARKRAASAGGASAGGASHAAPGRSPAGTSGGAPDIFAELSLSTASPTAAGEPAAAPAAAPAVGSAELASVGDAFGALCEIEGTEHAPGPAPLGAHAQPADSAAPDSAGPASPDAAHPRSRASTGGGFLGFFGGAAPSSPSAGGGSTSGGAAGAGAGAGAASESQLLPGLSEPLSPQDMLVFLQSGGSAEVLSQLHITPLPGAAVDRDGLYTLLQLLRQAGNRPHVTHFDFPPATLPAPERGQAQSPAAAAAAAAALAAAAADAVPSFQDWLVAQKGADAPSKPLILRGDSDASALASFLAAPAAAGASSRAGGGDDFAGLFAVAPPAAAAGGAAGVSATSAGASESSGAAAPVPGHVSQSAYSDLDALAAADEL